MAVREGLLVLLEAGPRHGYGLKSAFEQATGGVWPLNVGQVYTTLERLERDQLVEPLENQDGQRAWQLTDAGRGELGEWWWAVPGSEPPHRDELVLKVLLALAGEPQRALEVIGRQRDALLALLASRRREARGRTREGTDPLAAELAVEVLVLRAEADLRWLDVCEERVARADRAAGDAGQVPATPEPAASKRAERTPEVRTAPTRRRRGGRP
jgi:DNA-binding PadR family transcriptional regulator